MPLSPNDSRNFYLQIADDLRSQILNGDYGPGDKLPSVTDLTTHYDTSNMTIQNAVRALRDEGLLYSIRGRGTWVRTDIDLEELRDSANPELDILRHQVRDLGRRVEKLEAERGGADLDG